MENVPVEERIERVKYLKEQAAKDENHTLKCSVCGEKVVYVEDTEAREEGHIYSGAGRREYSMTRMCEHCFDRITKPPDEDDWDELPESGIVHPDDEPKPE